jgi:hypothetical protein
MSAAASSSKTPLSPAAAASKNYENMSNHELLNAMDEKSGVYFITNDTIHHPDQGLFVKIGLGINVTHRLESYLLCYPRGFTIFGVIFTTQHKLRKLEYFIHQYLAGKMRKMDENVARHSHMEEWFYLSPIQVSVLIHKVTDQFGISDFYDFKKPHFLNSNPQFENPKRRQKKPLSKEEREKTDQRRPDLPILQTEPRNVKVSPKSHKLDSSASISQETPTMISKTLRFHETPPILKSASTPKSTINPKTPLNATIASDPKTPVKKKHKVAPK